MNTMNEKEDIKRMVRAVLKDGTLSDSDRNDIVITVSFDGIEQEEANALIDAALQEIEQERPTEDVAAPIEEKEHEEKKDISEHIEKLVAAALTDGFITEKERATIRRIAEREGMDPDEAEMLLDARLQALNIKKKADAAHKKCPHCGAEIPAFSDRCPACGAELEKVKATSSVKELFDKINQIERSGEDRAVVKNKKITLISTFPVPNTREDLLEFLTQAAPNAKKIKPNIKAMVTQFLKVVLLVGIIGGIPIGLIGLGAADDGDGGSVKLTMFLMGFGAGAAAFGGMFGIIPAIFFALRKAHTPAQKEHNELAMAWRAKVEQVLAKAKLTLRSSNDQAEVQRVAEMLGL